jgi:hypothetical protein
LPHSNLQKRIFSAETILGNTVYGTEIEILAGFGPVGITEKKIGPIMSNFCGRFFMFS